MYLKYIIVFIAIWSVSFVTKAQTYTLNQCKEAVIKNNVKLKNKQLDVQASKQVKKAAFTKYFPQVSATAFAYKFNKPLIEMNIPGGNLPVYDGNPANILTATQFAYFPGMPMSLIEKGGLGMATATQPIYAGGRIATGNKLAKLGVEVSELQLKTTEKEILLETEKKYWQIVSLYEKRKTLNNYILLLDTLHKDVSNALEAGLITRNDLLKVELKQNELQMNLSQLQNGIELAQMAFCQYIGVEYNAAMKLEDQVEVNDTPDQYFVNHLEVLQNRDEHRLLQKSSQAEKYMTKMQRGEFLPQLAIGAGALHLDIMGGDGRNLGMAFGTVSIPISGIWEGAYKMKERRIKEEQNQNMVNDVSQKLLLQMQQGQNMFYEAYKQVQLAKVSIEQSEENLRVNQYNYEAGMVNVSDMLEAQAQVQKSQDDYIEACNQYQIAKLNYLQVTGR